jgi:hypothetical protein
MGTSESRTLSTWGSCELPRNPQVENEIEQEFHPLVDLIDMEALQKCNFPKSSI